MNIAIIGSGYVGLVTGSCFADLGNNVICVDDDKSKIVKLKSGDIPIYEPGLGELVKRNAKEGRLHFSTDINSAVNRSEIIFICVGTPPKSNGEADLRFVEHVSHDIAYAMTSYKLIVEKSTVPVNTGEWLERTIKDYNKHKVKFDVASNPEFLREGSAIKDFLNPDRIVIGVKSAKAREILMELYKPLKAEIVVTDIKSAELIKHAANSFLATKISFINSISNICDLIGADVSEVARGIGLDRRIGKDFLNAGIGFGGFCFPKDLGAFIHIAQKCGYDFGILKEVQKVNEAQKSVFVEKIETMLKRINGKTIAVLGLSFKPDTDDIRFAPSIDVISALLKRGARVRAYDPAAMPKARGVLGKRVKMCKDAYEAARGSDCLVIATEWNEFKELNLKRMKKILRQPVIVDGRNIYDPDEVRSAGFRYAGMGRR